MGSNYFFFLARDLALVPFFFDVLFLVVFFFAERRTSGATSTMIREPGLGSFLFASTSADTSTMIRKPRLGLTSAAISLILRDWREVLAWLATSGAASTIGRQRGF